MSAMGICRQSLLYEKCCLYTFLKTIRYLYALNRRIAGFPEKWS